MAIYDVFPFYNELDLLEIRLNELESLVDVFVITECAFTHSGAAKPLFFKDNSSRYRKFKGRILHQVVTEVPEGLSGFEIDWFQRDFAKSDLQRIMKDDDFLLYGDVDEIPKLSAIAKASERLSEANPIAYFAQDLFYYYVNLEEVSGKLLSNMGEFDGIENPKWLGTTMSLWSSSRTKKLSELRGPGHDALGLRIEDGGWHFSFIGGPDKSDAKTRTANKLAATAHQELNTQLNRLLLKSRVGKGRDLFGRRQARFVLRDDLDFLPDYLQQNIGEFRYLLLNDL
jgi:beta-1,4-mannosyl-glycoprotein beta-1,4-N-acetylglucosaminyltransferase